MTRLFAPLLRWLDRRIDARIAARGRLEPAAREIMGDLLFRLRRRDAAKSGKALAGPYPVESGLSAYHQALVALLDEARRAGAEEERLQSCLAPLWRFARENGVDEALSVGGSS